MSRPRKRGSSKLPETGSAQPGPVGQPPAAEGSADTPRGVLQPVRIYAYGVARNRMAQAAKRFGVTQPRMSNLMGGKFHLFSIDSLVEMLARAGMKVSVKLKKAA